MEYAVEGTADRAADGGLNWLRQRPSTCRDFRAGRAGSTRWGLHLEEWSPRANGPRSAQRPARAPSGSIGLCIDGASTRESRSTSRGVVAAWDVAASAIGVVERTSARSARRRRITEVNSATGGRRLVYVPRASCERPTCDRRTAAAARTQPRVLIVWTGRRRRGYGRSTCRSDEATGGTPSSSCGGRTPGCAKSAGRSARRSWIFGSRRQVARDGARDGVALGSARRRARADGKLRPAGRQPSHRRVRPHRDSTSTSTRRRAGARKRRPTSRSAALADRSSAVARDDQVARARTDGRVPVCRTCCSPAGARRRHPGLGPANDVRCTHPRPRAGRQGAYSTCRRVASTSLVEADVIEGLWPSGRAFEEGPSASDRTALERRLHT